MTAPRYQEVGAAQIPEIRRPDGTLIRVIAGRVGGVQGAVKEIAADPTYLDVVMPANASFEQPVARGHTAFAYVYAGEARLDAAGGMVPAPKLVVFGDGDAVSVQAGMQGLKLLLVSGKPLNEPVARYGPFVMNTAEEIRQTLMELRNGTFAQ